MNSKSCEQSEWQIDMVDTQNMTPGVIYLHYNKGEMIMKQGDYGMSIYKIVRGYVRIFQYSDNIEIPLATLRPGEIFGEMAFLTRLLEPRSASARAIEDTELEVWHPDTLLSEYDQMPPMIKYIISQTLNRLKWMNKWVGDLTKKRQNEREAGLRRDPQDPRRRYYRKRVDLACVYRPVGLPKFKLTGRIVDISRGGVCMDVGTKNIFDFSHNLEDEFELDITLPGGPKLEAVAKIRWARHNPGSGQIDLGLEFTRLTKEAGKTLGFFLMT